MTAPDEIIRIAARGDGITASGQHVAYSAPGDRIAADGGLIPGPHHVSARCQHFRLCGGCSLQQLDTDSYTEFLTDRIRNALDGQNLTVATLHPPAISPPHSRRRASLRAIRIGKQIHIGFHTSASHRVVDMRECTILRPELFALVAPLRQLLAHFGGRNFSSTIEMTLLDQGVDLALSNIELADLAKNEMVLAFAAEHHLARLTINQGFGPETLWEPEPVTISLGGVAVGFPTGAFLQATQEGEAALIYAVLQALAGARTVADLFAGLGTFSFALAKDRKIYAAEGARDAVAVLKMAANQRNLPIFSAHRDLFRNPLMPDELNRFDAILLDPPRAGAKEQCDQLAASSVARVCYVSCNPASWARDAKRLCDAGYTLDSVWPVGQFLWSTHVELVSVFSR